MYEGLMMVFIPMFLGYAIKIHKIKYLDYVNRMVMILLYLILLVMGIALGQIDNLFETLPMIALSALTFSLLIQGSNLLGLMMYDYCVPYKVQHRLEEMPSRAKLLFDSTKLCLMVVLGAIIGYWGKAYFSLAFGASSYVLMALIFFVGIQLRNNGIALKEVLLNRRGIIIGIIFSVTSLFGGALAAIILNLPVTQGLAIASGFGWYSLSSVIINDAWGAVFGSIAFFNDLSREILSLFLIPLIMLRYPSAGVGIAGATALDCTLPIIQKAGGMQVVPIAISFGVVTNILPPILMVIFSNIAI